MMKICKTCEYFKAEETPGLTTWATCRAHPPVTLSDAECGWPEVPQDGSGGCGEHKEKLSRTCKHEGTAPVWDGDCYHFHCKTCGSRSTFSWTFGWDGDL